MSLTNWAGWSSETVSDAVGLGIGVVLSAAPPFLRVATVALLVVLFVDIQSEWIDSWL